MVKDLLRKSIKQKVKLKNVSRNYYIHTLKKKKKNARVKQRLKFLSNYCENSLSIFSTCFNYTLENLLKE